jgi:hypothetical protein
MRPASERPAVRDPVEYEVMPRFTVKSLMYATAVVAALALLVKGGPTWVGFTGYVIYAGLLVWHICRQELDDRAKMRERREREGRTE